MELSGKALRFVAIAVRHEIERLSSELDEAGPDGGSADEDVQAEIINDIAYYEVLLSEMEADGKI